MNSDSMTELMIPFSRKSAAWRSRLMGPVSVVGLAALLLLTACSDDAEERPGTAFEAQLCTSVFEEEAGSRLSMTPFADTPFVTRTGQWPPSPYVTYSTLYGANGMFKAQKSLVNKSIDVFFTKDTDGGSKQEGVFFYRSSDETWHLNMEIEGASYYLYGYIPKEDVGSASIEGNSNYSDGAVLTLSGLNTVTPSDVCVIVGAKEGDSYSSDVTTGQFDVRAKTAVKASSAETPSETNYIYLLFDHLYTALRFNFTVDADYDALRTIKLRRLEMRACNEDYTEYVAEQCNATITLEKNSSGLSPIASVTYGSLSQTAISPSNPDAGYVAIYQWDNIANTDADNTHEVILANGSYTSFLGCFAPGSSCYFQIRSTYDVFDKKGNLIRRGCQAVNHVDLLTIFKEEAQQLRRGHCYSLSMKVQPTYLYMLSDPDLDNPSLSIN